MPAKAFTILGKKLKVRRGNFRAFASLTPMFGQYRRPVILVPTALSASLS